MSEISEKVVNIIVKQLGVTAEEVKPEASFVEDLGADSLDLTELIMAMEEVFDIEIADEDAQKMQKCRTPSATSKTATPSFGKLFLRDGKPLSVPHPVSILKEALWPALA